LRIRKLIRKGDAQARYGVVGDHPLSDARLAGEAVRAGRDAYTGADADEAATVGQALAGTGDAVAGIDAGAQAEAGAVAQHAPCRAATDPLAFAGRAAAGATLAVARAALAILLACLAVGLARVGSSGQAVAALPPGNHPLGFKQRHHPSDDPKRPTT
jgi:hypothetical protein